MSFIANVDISTALISIVIFLIIIWWQRRPKHLPPGPRGWPLVGYLPNFLISTYRTGQPIPQLFNSLAKEYGSVYSLNVAGKLIIVLNSFKNIKEGLYNPDLSDRPALQRIHNQDFGEGISETFAIWVRVFELCKRRSVHSPDLSDRPNMQRIHAQRKNTDFVEGIGGASGEAWKQQRRFTVTAFRGFGVGKRSFEENVAEEVEFLTKEINSFNGNAFDPSGILSNATSNVICSVVFGKRFEYSDVSFKRFMTMINQNAQTADLSLFVPIPFAKYLRPSSTNTVVQNVKGLLEFVKSVIDDHKKDYVNKNPRDYIDVYLDEIEASQKLNPDTSINYKNLPMTVRVLFSAGTETTSTTLRWAILYMMMYPEIQDRIHRELDSVVGRNRLPKLADKTELPFTCATLLEIQRIVSLLPLGVPHQCGKDTTLGPYSIPKGSIVVPNLWAVHHNPDIWSNPDEFNPERFLDENGVLQERDELIPFATGRRICLGEHLAKMELYIFFTHLLHQFTLKKPDDSPPLSLKGHNGFTNPPKKYLVQFVQRD